MRAAIQLWSLGAIGVLVGSSITAFAQAPHEDSAVYSPDEEGRARFEAGRLAFSQGRYEDALDDFRRAYQLTGRPQLLYNIGSTADRLRMDRDALEAFEEYLQSLDDSPLHAEVRRRVSVLRQGVGVPHEDGGGADVTELDPGEGGSRPAREDPSPSNRGPWLVIGGASALTVTGIALGVAGATQMRSWNDPPIGTRWDEVQSGHARGVAVSTVGWIAAGLGLAGLTVGILWLHKPQGERVSAQLDLGLGGLSLRGRF
jgi:tetratricopeptide (TPR) repeat protein